MGLRPTGGGGNKAEAPLPTDPRERTLAFWQAYRAGMDAIKVEGDPEKAEGHFRRALALDPAHEDARYYLAAALGPEWKPEGTVAEGDTKQTMHEDQSPLARFWRAWDGQADPETAYSALDEHLRRFRR